MDPEQAAALACTSLRRATVATLRTYPRLATRPHVTTVEVGLGGDGSAVVLLRPTSGAVQDMRVRPFASVTVAPAGCPRVVVSGAVDRLPERDHCGRVAFRVEPAAVRLGDDDTPVRVAALRSAAACRLGRESEAVLGHLRRPGQAELLAACLRAHGHDAQFAEAVALDAYGLTVLAVGLAGVTTVRLPFPCPITDLADLPTDLRVLLAHRCAQDRSCRPQAGSGPAPPGDGEARPPSGGGSAFR